MLGTRAAASVLVLAAMALLCLWSREFTFGNKALSFGAGLPVIAAAIGWSWREIFGLRPDSAGRPMWPHILVWTVLTLVPSCVLLGVSGEGESFGRSALGYGATAVGAGALLAWLWSRSVCGRVSWLECEPFFRARCFSNLAVSAFLFWNVILFMVICSAWIWMAIVFGSVALNDTAAYAAGRRWGRRPISSYSPNKTLEGLCIAVALVMAVLVLLWFSAPESLRVRLVGNVGAWWVPVPLLFAPGLLLCNLGDLQFSMNKRLFRIGEYSSVLGSHGGFWDRFDSHCFAFVYWGGWALVWQPAFATPAA